MGYAILMGYVILLEQQHPKEAKEKMPVAVMPVPYGCWNVAGRQALQTLVLLKPGYTGRGILCRDNVTSSWI